MLSNQSHGEDLAPINTDHYLNRAGLITIESHKKTCREGIFLRLATADMDEWGANMEG